MAVIARRLAGLDWEAVARVLDERGHATTPALLTGAECARLAAVYHDERRFRARVDMARFRFGVGEYKYFATPLPPLVAALRTHVYPHLAPLANRWMAQLGQPERFPLALPEFTAVCAARGQRRPTPLLLRYTAGGYNCLHQDLYGAVAFPLQLTCVLSRGGRDYTGGEFLLVEQRPRAQSRGAAIVLEQGAAVIFPTRHRPVAGTRGVFRATVRHGLSRVHTGERLALGVIFHDAE